MHHKNYKRFLLLFLAGIMICTIACNKDTTPPVLTILGSNPYTYCIQVPDSPPYNDEGATALDDEDGDITASISTSVDVDINVPGTYNVIYIVKDKAGNSTTATREVNVMYCK